MNRFDKLKSELKKETIKHAVATVGKAIVIGAVGGILLGAMSVILGEPEIEHPEDESAE